MTVSEQNITAHVTPNVTGGANVIITSASDATIGVASYANVETARRAVRSGAALRRLAKLENDYRILRAVLADA